MTPVVVSFFCSSDNFYGPDPRVRTADVTERTDVTADLRTEAEHPRTRERTDVTADLRQNIHVPARGPT
jgi:hypothetical protein